MKGGRRRFTGRHPPPARRVSRRVRVSICAFVLVSICTLVLVSVSICAFVLKGREEEVHGPPPAACQAH